MTITKITEDNSALYAHLIPEDLIDDLNREFYRGMIAEDEDSSEAKAGIIWELKNFEDESVPTEAEICWFKVSDIYGGDELFQAFDKSTCEEGVVKITIETKELETYEKTLLEQAGFSIEKAESRDICVTVGELSALNLGGKKIPPYIMKLSEISARQFKSGIMTSVFHGKYGILDDLPFLPMTRYDSEISSCVITDDKVTGLLLVHKTMTGELIVELLFAIQPDASINLLNMMRFSIRVAANQCNECDKVILRRHNKVSEALVTKLFPGKKGESVIRGHKDV